jgi:hypothetical protein
MKNTQPLTNDERNDATRADALCDMHNNLAGLEEGNGRATDVWHILLALRGLAKREGFDLRETFEDAMRFDPKHEC